MNSIWFSQDHLLFRTCPPGIREALICAGSLTEYLSRACTCELGLEIREESWQRAMSTELINADRRINRYFFVREINLSCGDTPILYGRSLFPRASYHYCKHQLKKLGARPLGNWLFNDERICRVQTQIGKIGKANRLYQLAMRDQDDEPGKLWGRRSVYSVNGYPLLVIEIFLPSLIKCIDTSKPAKTS
ncbi:MAG: chorismate lyase [Thiotrichales bacterium]|nr:chorismate lyase [Thiotrichales bacterium]